MSKLCNVAMQTKDKCWRRAVEMLDTLWVFICVDLAISIGLVAILDFVSKPLHLLHNHQHNV